MEASHPVVEQIIGNFYKNANIDRQDFHRQAKQNIRKDFDSYILPFHLNANEKKMKSNILNIINRPLDANAQILQFPPLLLESVLFLEPPKRVIQYVPVAAPPAYVEPKQKPAKVKILRGPQKPKPIKRSTPEVASIYAEEESQALKRAKATDDDDEVEMDVYPSDNEDTPAHDVYRKTPSNFEAVAGGLFEEFWRMEFEDDEVTWAFFAKITSANCKDYKLNTFADTSSSLAVIKVCILYHVSETE
jgi:hypothetical protein